MRMSNPELLSAFEGGVGVLWTRRANSLNELKTLTHMRDLLLPRLMSGEIRLSDAKRSVETVA